MTTIRTLTAAGLERAQTDSPYPNGHDGFYVTQRNGDGSYDLYRVRLEHVGLFRRKWQAIKTARGEQAESIFLADGQR